MPNLIPWLASRRWWIIALISLGLLVFEVWEDQSDPSTLYHMLEMFIYVIFLGSLGILVGALVRSVQKQKKYLDILDTKHKINLELAGSDDWDSLVNRVVKFPSRIVAVEMSCLYVQNPVTLEFVEIAHWEPDGDRTEIAHPDLKSCLICTSRENGGGYTFSACEQGELGEAGGPGSRWFCLPVASGSDLIAVMQFQIGQGITLTSQQKLLFESIGDEIAVALKAGQVRQVMREISDAEISLNERRKVSYFLHDNLAQNIGFLRLKLDQILREKDSLSQDQFRDDLVSMQDVTNDSYDTVRGILESLTPSAMPGFGSTISELARKLGKRAHLEVSFNTTGVALDLPVEVSRAMLYASQEILSNIEKHARATKLDIQIVWKEQEFSIHFSDNGVGFNPERVDTSKHFGLGILYDRLAAVNGRIGVSSTEMLGTTVVLSAPVQQIQLQR
jgi:signal transduction histidine kinase